MHGRVCECKGRGGFWHPRSKSSSDGESSGIRESEEVGRRKREEGRDEAGNEQRSGKERKGGMT